MALPMRNPMDSMKSTWRTWDRKQWTGAHWFLDFLNVHHIDLDKDFPVHDKTEKVPNAPELQFHVWILIHASIPLLLHQLYIYVFGHNMSPWLTYIFYNVSLQAIAIHETRVLRRLGHVYGFFDGDKHPRDGVPDVGVAKTVQSVLSVITFRPMFTVWFAYQPEKAPSSIPLLWTFIETGAYAWILDFWYYTFHRLAHESENLWKFHRTHHLTKHPNPLLTAYADTVQEFFDIAGAPLLTYFTMRFMGFPMGFYDWWICQVYVVFTEILGHSGLRMFATAANPWTWLMKVCNTELVIEDHDMHHRRGWKKSYNYGKQTRIWDQLFGTTHPRIEGHADNIDYVNTAKVPLL